MPVVSSAVDENSGRLTRELNFVDRALLDIFYEIEMPEGLRLELIEGEMVVTGPAEGDHEDILDTLVWQIHRCSGTRMSWSGAKGLILPDGEGPPNHVIPDGVLAPRELRPFRGAGPWMHPDEVTMVVEVISSGQKEDRKRRRRCYAKAELPHFLVIDQPKRRAVLFSNPDGEWGEYKESMRVAFGSCLKLPEPFGFALDTAEFE
ncbi:Uma2 family endonuclease [Actinomadura rupiterrae]|uniref:Uma2 family endonuclease n=1 Tax=Actinomadura rupiterrae TaxID=559627 RepID=UPI0020A4F64D|nr:Uma2 family endonuclease [Actinomadura rupiterrae]MCP2335127.1 Uma2 family endonuclease [Actinomadura rupiterrae]